MKRFIVALATLLSLAAPARGQNYLACQVGGIVTTCPTDVRLKTGAFLLNPYINWASPGALGSTAASTVRGTTVTATTQFTGSGVGLTDLPAASVVGSLSGVGIDCASNTCQNIANAALVNSSITVTAGTGLSGGGVVNLGGTVSLALPSVGPGAGAIAYPASITLDAQGRISAASAGSAPAPATRTITAGIGLTGGGDLSADRTLAIAATTVSAASYPTSGQIPTFAVNAQGQLTAAGSTTTLTSPAIASPIFSGSATGTYTLAGTPTITAPAISGPTLSGTVLGTYTFGGTPTFPATGVSAAAYPTVGLIPTFTVGVDGRLSAAGSASSLSGVTINCSSNTCSNVSLTTAVTGVLPIANGGTNSSTALGNNRPIVSSGGKLVETASTCGVGTVLVGGSPPDCGAWITSTAGVSTLGSTYTISADNGAYEDTGLSVTLPSAGTYIVWYTARTNISALTTAGAFVEVELYNSTDAGAVANSEEIGAYASTLAVSYYGVPHLNAYITVAASKVIKLYAKAVAPGSTTVRTVNSDTNGRTNMGYIKIAP